MGNDPSDQKENAGDVTIRFGHDELVIRQRYEVISIINDILIGTWFIIGTIFFFFPSLAYAGTWLFLLGSIEMMIRPIIRLARRVHLRRYHTGVPRAVDAGHDF
ncbi:YrhK family protein [Marinobacter sp. GN3S48]|uniref:YrhK family protein n=1 Tax=Marinobacter sp. GN3S48 TaxID=3382302 RepID=UPI00387AF0B8